MTANFFTNPPEYIRHIFFILFLISTILWLLGAHYNAHSNKLIRHNLRRPHNILNILFNIFTARLKIEKDFKQQQILQTLTAEELEISFNTHIIGQERACHDMSHYIHYFLNLSNDTSPMNIFLFQGVKETGRTSLAKIIAQKLHYNFITIEENAPLSCFLALQTHKDATKQLILIKEITKISLEAQHFLVKLFENNQKDIFIFIHTPPSHLDGENERDKIPQILYKKISRDIYFEDLNSSSTIKIIAKTLEKKIQNAGFYIQNGIFPPALIQEILFSQTSEHDSLHQKIAYFENMINPSLIAAKQKGTHSLTFSIENKKIKIETSKERN